MLRTAGIPKSHQLSALSLFALNESPVRRLHIRFAVAAHSLTELAEG
jgi:hypothetical protein